MARLFFALFILAAGLASPAWGDTLRVLTAGAFKQVVQEMAPEFEQRTGHKVLITNDTAGSLTRRIEQGEPFDIVIVTPAALKALDQKDLLLPGTVVSLARVGVGIAVKHGRPHPALNNVDDFILALKSAHKVAYIDPASGGSSGIYLQRLFQQLNLESTLSDKAVLVKGGLVAEKLVTDDADLAIHQISEILAVTGVDLVGPLPSAIQNYTHYAGALSRQTRNADAGRMFLTTLTSALATRIMTSKGLER
jgi:molybdate transport system substrate-binding protein